MDEKLRFDYEQTIQRFVVLADARFKLLVAIPALSAVVIALLAGTARPGTDFTVGILGLVLVVVTALYGLRNAVAYETVVERGKALEKKLELPNYSDGKTTGGLFSEKPGNLKLLGLFDVHYNLGFALVYGAVFGVWLHIVLSTLLAVIGIHTGVISIPLAVVGGVLFGLLLLQLSAQHRAHSKGAGDKPASPPAKPLEVKPAVKPSVEASMPPAPSSVPTPPVVKATPAAPPAEEKTESPASEGEAAKPKRPRAKKTE